MISFINNQITGRFMSSYIGFTSYQPGWKALASDVCFGAIVLGTAHRWGGRAATSLTKLSRKTGEAYMGVGLPIGAGVFALAQAVGEAVIPDSAKPFLKCASIATAAFAFHKAGAAGAKQITGQKVTLADAVAISSLPIGIAASIFACIKS